MSWRDMIADASDVIVNTFGASAVYHSAVSGDVSMDVILDKDVEVEEEGGAFIRRTLLSFKSGQVTPSSNDSVTVDGVTYSVEQLESDDGYMTRVVLGRRL